MKITGVSDLHGHYPETPGGDLLIVSGDLTATDKPHEYVEFGCWLGYQEYKKKIVVAGNHDNFLTSWKPGEMADVNYLYDSGCEFDGLKIWGSPWTLTFPGMNPDCKAFTVDTEDELSDKWQMIPRDIDILVTHMPPYCVGDKILGGRHVGSRGLYAWFLYVGRPKLHVFGHIHEGYGKHYVFNALGDGMVVSVNASIMNQHYEPVNKPITIEI
jgi:Icc-related predicted phosphoesterase